ncbi:MAG: hypothetical protein RJQ00_04025 [Vicingaceae bacterium]
MSNFSDNLNRLEKDVIQLIKQKNDLKIQLQEAIQIQADLKEKLSNQQRIEIELREKNKILRIAGGQKGEGNREMKLKINEIVREVDKCIAQLNQ